MDNEERLQNYKVLALVLLKQDNLPCTEEAIIRLAKEMMDEDDLVDGLDMI